MDKKVSEMTLEELQDYTLALESQKQALADELTTEQAKTLELQELNKALQKRNNDLFMKVEQQPVPQSPAEQPDEHVQTCEEFAQSNLLKEIRI